MFAAALIAAEIAEFREPPDDAEMKQHRSIPATGQAQADTLPEHRLAGRVGTDRCEIEIRHLIDTNTATFFESAGPIKFQSLQDWING